MLTLMSPYTSNNISYWNKKFNNFDKKFSYEHYSINRKLPEGDKDKINVLVEKLILRIHR